MHRNSDELSDIFRLRVTIASSGCLLEAVDPEFGDVLDGLILVDLMQTDRKALGRYMGKEGLAVFRSYHEELAGCGLSDCA